MRAKGKYDTHKELVHYVLLFYYGSEQNVTQVAKTTGTSLTTVNNILAKYNRDSYVSSEFVDFDGISDLLRGDIVRHMGQGNSYVVSGFNKNKAILVRTIVLSNPEEWRVMREKQ